MKQKDDNPFEGLYFCGLFCYIFLSSLEGSGLQSLDSFYVREDPHPQHFGELLKPQEEGGISISIKYEIRSSDRVHEPILTPDGMSENYFDHSMMESNPDILSQSNRIKEMQKILKQFRFFLKNLRYQKLILESTDLYREVLQNFLHLEKLTICCVKGVKESNKPENTFVATDFSLQQTF